MIPSAPTATPPIASGLTSQRLPVACDGSTTTGRWVRWCTTGTAVRSSVLRAYVSNVRMPRSHMMMFGLPAEAMYSAAISHSSIVAPKPRLSITGRPGAPAGEQQREVLHVPGADLEDVGVLGDDVDLAGSMTSVITGRPVRSRASAR